MTGKIIKYFLHTQRLGLRTWSEDDFELAVALWGDFEVTKLFDARGPLSREQVKERLLKEISTQKEFGVQYWPIFLLENVEHIGACGLRPYDMENNILETGFHIRSNQWGKGYATEAARGVIEYAFEELKVNGLFAGHNPKNEASRYLLHKLGFHYTHDEFYEPTGLQHPSYLMKVEDFSVS